jgi:hypothetical protein
VSLEKKRVVKERSELLHERLNQWPRFRQRLTTETPNLASGFDTGSAALSQIQLEIT